MTNHDVWTNALIEAQQTLAKFLANPEQIARCEQFSKMLTETFKSGGEAFRLRQRRLPL